MRLETRRLGQSDLAITRVGIGTAPIGSAPTWQIYWGPQDELESIRAIHQALDLGINWIDIAPFYGWGRAERIVGEALRGRRESVYVFTKCGTLPDGQGGATDNLTPASIRREVEMSLRNLHTEYIDLYQFHDPDPATPVEESWATMQALIREGKVRYGGLSNHPTVLMERALTVGPITSNQHQYNLLNREIERDVLPYSQRHGIGVLCWSPLASGFLADGFEVDRLDPNDFRRLRLYAQEPAATEIARIRGVMQAIAQRHAKTLVDVAIAWVLRHAAVTGAIVGIRSEREAAAMLGGTDWTLTPAEQDSIARALADWPSSAAQA